MAIDFVAISRKWQQIWEENKIYEPEPQDRPKYYITTPYPYINGLLHLGHGFTYLRGDILARYKLLKGYNVLRPQGWHATGAPIVGAALQVKERAPKWIKILESYEIPKEDISKFENPEYWVFYFSKKGIEAFKALGIAVDWRRTFFTTYLNEAYSKFVQWQYRKLREKGLIVKGKHPVVWDPKVQRVIGDHDRPDEYAGIQPQEGYIIKFKLKDSSDICTDTCYLPCFTFRPETVYGVTNLWINPDAIYVLARVDGEIWVLSKDVVEEVRDQEHDVEVLSEIRGEDLLGRKVENIVTGESVIILPANFVNPEIGTGVVMSVPAHAPYDFIALKDLETNPVWSNAAKSALDNIKSLFKVEGFSEYPAKDIIDQMNISSQKDVEKLEKATQTLYSKEFYNGILKEIFGKWAGKRISEVKDEIASELSRRGIALKHYILPIRFESRYGGKVHVKIVSDQWFIRYSDPNWKNLAHRCVDKMITIPEEVRKHLHYTIDWLKDWACTHKGELGTSLPWDPQWTIESLSDSTIYMAYYILAKWLQNPEKYGIDISRIDDSFFDYVLLDEGNVEEVSRRTGISKELLNEMRAEVDYWYPVDMRLSAKDLIQNHLTFYIFHHVAIFPEEKWPKGIAINGHVLINGEKMSKSKGNVIPILFAVREHGADPVRFIIAYAGDSGYDDANIEYTRINEIKEELSRWYEFCINYYNTGRSGEKLLIDHWMENMINKFIKEAELEYEEINSKSIINKVFYDMQNALRWYLRRTGNNPHKEVINKYILTQAILLWPIIPHLSSEILYSIGYRQVVPEWPKSTPIDEDILLIEEFIKNLREDIIQIKNLVKVNRPSQIKIILASEDKYRFFREVREIYLESSDLREMYHKVLEKYGKDPEKVRLLKKIMRDPKFISRKIDRELDLRAIEEAKAFFETEFGARLVVELEEDSKEQKAKNAIPGKPAIIIYP